MYKDTGRFPANIIISEEVAPLIDEQSGVSNAGKYKGGGSKSGGIWNKSTGKPAGQEYGDKGGASRFFKNIPLDSRIIYTPKASKKERNIGCECVNAKKTNDGRQKEADNAYQRGKTVRNNFHPTVKPLKLMEYLSVLTKIPNGGIVLDPFAGSGTTGVACINTGRKFILIEKEEEYIKIINARIDGCINKNG